MTAAACIVTLLYVTEDPVLIAYAVKRTALKKATQAPVSTRVETIPRMALQDAMRAAI